MKKSYILLSGVLIIILFISLVSSTFPVVESSSSQSGGSGNHHYITMPDPINVGDLLIVAFVSKAYPTVPSGWTTIASAGSGTSTYTIILAKIADATENATIVDFYVTANEYAYAQIYRISNFNGTLDSLEVSSASTGYSANPDPSILTPSWGSDDTLWLALTAWGYGADALSTYPTSYTDGIWGRSGSSISYKHYGIASAIRELKSSSEDPGVFTLSSTDSWAAFTIGIQPLPGGDPGYSNKVSGATIGKFMGVNVANVGKIMGA